MDKASPIDVFIAYAKADSDLMERLRIQLSAAERIGLIDTWHDGEIEIGTDTQAAMEAAMNKAEIILLLISADFFASEVYEKEMPLAMSLYHQKKAKVIPVILRECTWQMTPIAGLKVLPPNGIPVTNKHWTSPDQAFRLVVEEVVKLSSQLRGTPMLSGTTTVTTEHQEYTKTVIAHEGDKNEVSTFNWKPLVMGVVAALVIAFLGFQLFSKKDQPSISKETSKELIEKTPVETTSQPPVRKEKKTPDQPIAKEPIKQQPQRESKKEELPQTFDQPKKASREELKTPKQYQLYNNTLTDLRNQKKYPVILLNGQTWMAKNLAFNTTGALCFRNQRKNCTALGGLYNFDLAQKVCPKGWRLPLMKEWLALSQEQIKSLQLPRAGVYDGNSGWLFGETTGFYWTSERSFAGEAKAFRISKSSSGKESRYTKWSLSCRCILDD